MDLGLKNKTAIVTGGASNIGRAISLTFAAEGTNVVIADIDEEQAGKVSKEGRNLGSKMSFIHTDVGDWDSVQAMVKKALEEFKTVDILVNNVGWSGEKLFVEQPREEWEKEIRLNIWGTINCIRAVVDHMIEKKYGKIITIGSDGGRIGENRQVVYAGTKGAGISITKGIARELGRYGINANDVCPGLTMPGSSEEVGEKSMFSQLAGMGMDYTKSEIMEKAAKGYPLRRLGKPTDIANAVVFLASDRASFITGQTLSVSGGYTMM